LRKILFLLTVGAFYRYVNRRITSNSSVGVTVDHSGAHLTDNVLIANAFNNYFAAVGTSDNNITPTCDTQLCSTLDNIVIDAADVMSSIDKLKCNCSCGPDGLLPILFIYLKHCLCHPLALMYN